MNDYSQYRQYEYMYKYISVDETYFTYINIVLHSLYYKPNLYLIIWHFYSAFAFILQQ